MTKRPILFIVLDGMGDRRHPELGGLTPLEAARTPNLDALATSGVTGLMWPLGPGRATSSPLAHTVLFGYDPTEYPGRGVIEAIGEGFDPTPGEVIVRANFVQAEERAGELHVTERPDPRVGDDENADIDLTMRIDGIDLRFVHTGAKQGLLFLRSEHQLCADVTDADPLRADVTARKVMAFAEATHAQAAQRTASALNAWMVEAHRRLRGRRLDLALVKWASMGRELPPFVERTGLHGCTLARGVLYRGLAKSFALDLIDTQKQRDDRAQLEYDLGEAIRLLGSGSYDFVHVHTKTPDDAGHRKDPVSKRDVLAELDAAFSPYLEVLRAGEMAVCITADHQTPASGPLYHSGGAVPLLICGGAAGVDSVAAFGERTCGNGGLGTLVGSDLMPVLLDVADRSAFLGVERYTALPCLGTPSTDSIEPLRI